MTARQSDESGQAFSPVENEAPLRWWRRLHLVSKGDLGAGRRAVLFALLTWLPMAIWALANDRMLSAETGEPLLKHYSIHIRCLVAIPLFILAEAALHRTGKALAQQFVTTGIVTPALLPKFEQTIRDVTRVRNASSPWIFAIGAAIAWSFADPPSAHEDVMAWSFGADRAVGFGGWWFAYVARPVFLALVLGWLWRVGLVAYWMWRVSRLDLAVVPTHPDRLGGLGFLQTLPGAFSLVSLGMSVSVASHWAHDILHHDAPFAAFQYAVLVFVALWSLVMLVPLLAFAPALLATRTRALVSYSTLSTRHGQLVHRRWILGENVEDDSILDAPEIGPVADAGEMYAAVRRMRTVPIGKQALGMILTPTLIPLLLVATLRVPLPELLLKLAKALV